MRDDQYKPPWYVDAIYKFGIPSAIAAYLVWNLVEMNRTNQLLVTTTMTEIQKEMRSSNADSGYIIMKLEQTEILLTKICVNAGRTASDRNSCYNR